MGLILPNPGEEGPARYWFSTVTTPANTGAETDVPPTIEEYASAAPVEPEIPFAHVLAVLPFPVHPFCSVQKM
jgi:hypothetical protein